MGKRKLSTTHMDTKAQRNTFQKRKMGLLKKAYEIGALCSCEVGVIIIQNDRLVQYATTDMDPLLLRYTEARDSQESRTNADIEKYLIKKGKSINVGDDDDEDDDDGFTTTAPSPAHPDRVSPIASTSRAPLRAQSVSPRTMTHITPKLQSLNVNTALSSPGQMYPMFQPLGYPVALASPTTANLMSDFNQILRNEGAYILQPSMSPGGIGETGSPTLGELQFSSLLSPTGGSFLPATTPRLAGMPSFWPISSKPAATSQPLNDTPLIAQSNAEAVAKPRPNTATAPSIKRNRVENKLN